MAFLNLRLFLTYLSRLEFLVCGQLLFTWCFRATGSFCFVGPPFHRVSSSSASGQWEGNSTVKVHVLPKNLGFVPFHILLAKILPYCHMLGDRFSAAILYQEKENTNFGKQVIVFASTSKVQVPILPPLTLQHTQPLVFLKDICPHFAYAAAFCLWLFSTLLSKSS